MFGQAYSQFIPSESPSPNLQTLLLFCEAMNEWNHKKIMSVFDETLEHRVLPKSLGRPILTKRQYSDYLVEVMPFVRKYKIFLHEVIEVDDTVTVHVSQPVQCFSCHVLRWLSFSPTQASSTGESRTGTPCVHETIFIIHFVPPRPGGDGLPKMKLVKEFVDSLVSRQFFSEERAKLASAGSASRSSQS